MKELESEEKSHFTMGEIALLYFRYGWNGCTQMTLEECSNIFGLPKEHLRDIQSTAIKKLERLRG